MNSKVINFCLTIVSNYCNLIDKITLKMCNKYLYNGINLNLDRIRYLDNKYTFTANDKWLSKLTGLRQLVINNKISNEGLKNLKELEALYIIMSNNNNKNEDEDENEDETNIYLLNNLTNLKLLNIHISLNMNSYNFNDDIKNLIKLNNLTIKNGSINNEILNKLPNIKILRLLDNKDIITYDGIKNLNKLECFHIMSNKNSKKFEDILPLDKLYNFPKLKKIKINDEYEDIEYYLKNIKSDYDVIITNNKNCMNKYDSTEIIFNKICV